MQSYRRLVTLAFGSGLLAGGLVACSTAPSAPSSVHLRAADASEPARTAIPAPVQTSTIVPKPRPASKTETYSVVVNNIKAQELLFALARDAKVNVDIHPGIQGTVTLNAIDQTLQQLLQRIARQVDMRWELDGANLTVMPDTPFLRAYKVDYVNMSRDSSATVSANSQISSGLSGGTSSGGGSSGGVAGASGNISITKVENKVSNHFWESLEKNLKDLLRETDKVLPEGSSEIVVERSDQQSTTGTGSYAVNGSRNSSRQNTQTNLAGSPNPAAMQQDETTVTRRSTYREAASIIVNAETGIISVRATGRQHEKVQEFLDLVTSSARRQVMIEATIVEVELSNGYQQGINWTRIRNDGSTLFSVTPSKTTTTANQDTTFSLRYLKPLDINLTLNLLEQFGNVKVLSSPRLSVLNNQSALLKVVENKVYFTVKADLTQSSVIGGTAIKAITTTPQSVSVGLVMMVTPQISENNSITLNVRPSITSISNYVSDPNPEIPVDIGNKIPEIRTREMESVMRVEDGEIAVLGGLMQERSEYNTGRVPGIGAIPWLGEAFTSRNNAVSKSELVIFLRPVVIRDPSINGDYRKLKGSLPGDNMFTQPANSQPFGLSGNTGGAQ